MPLPLVTVITPTYNRADFLPETIRSVLMQGYKNLQYIIFNDGSSDNTSEVIKPYLKYIEYYSHENQGENKTVNAAYEKAKGKYILVVNSDDPLLPDAIHALVDALENSPKATMAYSDWARIDENGNFISTIQPSNLTLEKILDTFNCPIGPATMMLTEAVKTSGGRDTRYRYAGDLHLYLKMLTRGKAIYIEQTLGTHREHGNSASISTPPKSIYKETFSAVLRILTHEPVTLPLRIRRYDILREGVKKALTSGRFSINSSIYLYQELVLYSLKHYYVSTRYFLSKSKSKLTFLFKKGFKYLKTQCVLKITHIFFWLIALILRLFYAKQQGGSSNALPKVAFYSPVLPPRWSGQAIVIGRLLCNIPVNEYYCIAEDGTAYHDEELTDDTLGCNYYLLPKRSSLFSRKRHIPAMLSGALLIIKRAIDLINIFNSEKTRALVACSGDFVIPPAAYIAAKACGIDCHYYLFDDYTEQWWGTPAIRKAALVIERTIFPSAKSIIVPSTHMYTKIVTGYYPHVKTSLIYNPMPSDLLPRARTRFPFTDGVIKLVFTGAIYHLNFDVFRQIIAAIQQLKTQYKIELHIYTAQPKSLLESEGIHGTNIFLHQHMTPKEIALVQSTADILLIPFSKEPKAYDLIYTSATAKLADFLATGRPILAITPCSAFAPNFLNAHQCGEIVLSTTPDAIAQGIKNIISDEKKRKRFFNNARLIAKLYFSPKRSQKALMSALNFTEHSPPHTHQMSSTHVKKSLNILQVTAYDLEGEQANGYVLHQNLCKHGHNAQMAVFRSDKTAHNVHELGTYFERLINRAARVIGQRNSWYCLTPTLSHTLFNKPYYKQADIIQLQLIHGAQFFSLDIIPKITKEKPVVFSLHEMFMMTGHCNYSIDCERWKTGCGKCPDLKRPFSIQRDTTAEVWQYKYDLMNNLQNVHLVVASPWMERMAKESPILRHLPIHYIPFGIDTDIYHMTKKSSAKKELGIPEDADVFCFRSTLFNPYKGTDYISRALELYTPRRKTYIITLQGMRELRHLDEKYHFIECGWIENPADLAKLLQAADIFLMPSLAEAFGLMAVEAMACGTPVITFEGTALPETINAPECGIAVPAHDTVALKTAMEELMFDDKKRNTMAQKAHEYVRKNHSMEQYVTQYEALYEQILRRKNAA